MVMCGAMSATSKKDTIVREPAVCTDALLCPGIQNWLKEPYRTLTKRQRSKNGAQYVNPPFESFADDIYGPDSGGTGACACCRTR